MDSSADKQYQEQLQAARTYHLNHEKDPRWTAVDEYALKQLYVNSPDFAAINQAVELSEKKGLPSIEVSLLQGKWLLTQCQMVSRLDSQNRDLHFTWSLAHLKTILFCD